MDISKRKINSEWTITIKIPKKNGTVHLRIKMKPFHIPKIYNLHFLN